MRQFAHPIQFGNDVCEALDIQTDATTGIDISIHVGDMPTIDVHQYVIEGHRLIPVLKRYQLVPIPPTRMGRLKLRILRRLIRA